MFDDILDDIDALCGDTQPKPRIRVYALIGRTVELVSKAVQALTHIWTEYKERDVNRAGHTCPHCEGTGRYRMWLNPNTNAKCYRCDGKGIMNDRDMAYLRRRLEGHGPVSTIRSA
ncbi:hypothetical protein VPH49_21885 [Pseudomonas luteola]|uniref:hypothetical protein n=1 Tax=Pseudomonas luteola TaxID=47886 RepID=UPI003A8C49AF